MRCSRRRAGTSPLWMRMRTSPRSLRYFCLSTIPKHKAATMGIAHSSRRALSRSSITLAGGAGLSAPSRKAGPTIGAGHLHTPWRGRVDATNPLDLPAGLGAHDSRPMAATRSGTRTGLSEYEVLRGQWFAFHEDVRPETPFRTKTCHWKDERDARDVSPRQSVLPPGTFSGRNRSAQGRRCNKLRPAHVRHVLIKDHAGGRPGWGVEECCGRTRCRDAIAGHFETALRIRFVSAGSI